MKTEENKRMFTLSCIVADLKAENIELAQRVHQLVDDYNNVVRLLNGKETRKDKNSKPTLGEVLDVRSRCYKLEVENSELKRFAKAMHAFVKDKNIYMRKGTSCGYTQGYNTVCSTYCLECKSCVGVIEGLGVICEKRLKEASVSLPDNVGEVRLVEASSSLATDVCEERLAEESAVFPNDE